MASFELRVERSDLMKPLLTSRLFSAASDRIVLVARRDAHLSKSEGKFGGGML